MIKQFILPVCLAFAHTAFADEASDSLIDVYSTRLDSLVSAVQARPATTAYNPYCIQLFSPGTLWNSPLRQVMTTGESDTSDPQLHLLQNINRQLMETYTSRPWLVTQTEAQLAAEESLITTEVVQKETEKTLAPVLAPTPELVPEVDEVDIVVEKPNFWKVGGDASLQLTQNYFSGHWYQGGDNFYSLLALLNLKVNYDNKQGLQWENLLEMKLGFQTNANDTVHSYKTFNDQLRFTSKVGYKAAKNWNYAAQVQSWTQFLPSFESNSERYKARFAAPLDLVVSVGMDWKVKLKRFEGSLYIAPVAYSMRYVSEAHTYHKTDYPDIHLTSHHGVDDGKYCTHNYGPNITFKYTWTICQSVKWDARLYVMTDLNRTVGEFENTFTFTINKFLNSKLYLYPRYDDSDLKKYKNDKGHYVMFKEWLSLGLNFVW